MINTAKISAEVRQIGQFDAGVMSFKTKYGYMPGDAPAFGGNGDGLIDYPDRSLDAFGCEQGNFWHDFNPQEFTVSATCNVPGIAAISDGPSKTVPPSQIGKANSFIVASALSLNTSYADAAPPKNFYAILDSSQMQLPFAAWYRALPTTSSNSATTPADTLALDAKMDDGLANSGNVLSGNVNAYYTIYINPISTCSQGANYQVQNSGYECTPLIRIGAQTGDPQ